MKNGAEETNKNRETMKTGVEGRKQLKTNEVWPIFILCRAPCSMGLIVLESQTQLYLCL